MTTFQFYQKRTPATLDEVLYPDCASAPRRPCDRESFIRFLSSSHCLENLEFVLEIDTFVSWLHSVTLGLDLEDVQDTRVVWLASKWSSIYHLYLHPDGVKEVNVPNIVLGKFRPDIIPKLSDLHEIRSLIYDLLMVNYMDFLSHIRETEADMSIGRRKLDMVSPEAVCTPQHSVSPFEKSSFIWPVSPDLVSRSSEEETNAPVSCGRSGSAGTISTRTSSRGSSMGSIFDSIKEHTGYNKTMQILRTRRTSLERHESFIH